MKKTGFLIAFLAAALCFGCIAAFAARYDSDYDINGDGTIGAADLTRLMRFISGQEVTVSVSDTNGDGATDSKDLTRLMKFIAGIIGTEDDTAATDTQEPADTDTDEGGAETDAVTDEGQEPDTGIGKPDPLPSEPDEIFDLVNDAITDTYYASNGVAVTYRMHLPADYSEEYAYPVLTVLHGIGHEGNDGILHVDQNFMTAPYYISTSPLYQCIVIYPQCPSGTFTNWKGGKGTMTDQMGALIELLDSINETYSVNLDRQYIMGFSAGGYATWELLARCPDRFAAAMPVAGGGDPSYAELLKDTYIYVYHDAQDGIISVENSRRMYNAIKDVGGEKITYTETTGYGHFSILDSIEVMTIYDWFFDKVKE